MNLQHVPGDDVFFAHVKCPSLCIYGLKSVLRGNRLREIIEICRAKNQCYRAGLALFTRRVLTERQ
ncbi:hypothetical protein CRX67_19455 [Enterobacteriaceae bacterium A-F18]|nr:hypothetical protein C9415_24270 [Kluyvera sp. Nf5]QIH65083.1 hypothetical protein CRX67_19455 [Enterobacteriaceae bacterium A-F18]